MKALPSGEGSHNFYISPHSSVCPPKNAITRLWACKEEQGEKERGRTSGWRPGFLPLLMGKLFSGSLHHPRGKSPVLRQLQSNGQQALYFCGWLLNNIQTHALHCNLDFWSTWTHPSFSFYFLLLKSPYNVIQGFLEQKHVSQSVLFDLQE